MRGGYPRARPTTGRPLLPVRSGPGSRWDGYTAGSSEWVARRPLRTHRSAHTPRAVEPAFRHRCAPLPHYLVPVYVACGGDWKMYDADTARYMQTLIEGGLTYLRETSAQHATGHVTHRHGEADHLAHLTSSAPSTRLRRPSTLGSLPSSADTDAPRCCPLCASARSHRARLASLPAPAAPPGADDWLAAGDLTGARAEVRDGLPSGHAS